MKCLYFKKVKVITLLIRNSVLINDYLDGDTTITRDGDQINRFLVADRTASILLNVWGEAGEYIQGGDILRITGA